MNADEFRQAVTNQYAEGTALGDAARNLINLYLNSLLIGRMLSIKVV